MEIKKNIAVCIDDEEYEILEKAEKILDEICNVFENHDECQQCPFLNMCTKLGAFITPSSIVCSCKDILDVQEKLDG